MARNGNGQYTLPAGNPVVPGTTITTEWANSTLNDIATALTGSVASDGQTSMQGNLDMSNNKIVGLTNGTAPQDAATVNQLANAAITGGTINGATIGNTNPKDGNFLNLTANTGDFSDGLTAPTVTPSTDVSNKVATTQFVQNAIAAVSSGVTSFNGRSGVVTLQAADVNNALGFTPYNAGTNTVVTSANVLDYTVGKTGQGATGNWGISISGSAATANSANTVDSITSNQVSTALGYVPLSPNSPALLGTPTAPTAPTGTNTTQLATTAFVLANQGGGGGAVSSVNGKTGAVTLNASDVGAYPNNNPSGFTTLAAVQAQGYTTLAIVQSQGYQTAAQVQATLGGYVTTNTVQTLTAAKTFTGGVAIGGVPSSGANTITSGAYNFNATSSIFRDQSGSIFTVTGAGQLIVEPSGLIKTNKTTGGDSITTPGAINVNNGTGGPGSFLTLQPGVVACGSPTNNWILNGNANTFQCLTGVPLAVSMIVTETGSLGLQRSSANAFKPGGGAWQDTSDIRLKSDIQTLTTCLDTIVALNPVSFTWKTPYEGAPNVGFIADEVEQVIPTAVSEITLNEEINTSTKTYISPTQYAQAQKLREEKSIPEGEPVVVKAIGWKNDMFAYLVGAIKELSAQVDTLQTEINTLKAK